MSPFTRLLVGLLFFCSLRGSAQTKVLVCQGSETYAYHTHHCSGLNHCTHGIIEVTMQEAQQMGRDSCEICYHYTRDKSRKPLPVSDSEDGICHAITQKGTRCSRKARSNGMCWQHGG